MDRLGAIPSVDGVTFRVWAPDKASVAVRHDGRDWALEPAPDGTWSAGIHAHAGDDYWIVLDGEPYADPCSREQPEGLDGPSRVVDAATFDIAPFDGVPLEELVVYELHVGTFSEEGTFDGVIPRLAELRELGITAIELMPVATFPGHRNWGYDGVFTFAPHPAYGGPQGLARLIDAAHRAGLGVILDVVYNHVGPGHRLKDFGPYFTDTFDTFWGDALDYSQEGVREWAIQNAEQWIRDFQLDGLRLDAVHSVFDDSPRHVLAELCERVKAIDPRALVISEMGQLDLSPLQEWGHDAMWLDNLHHELHVLLTDEHEGYYEQFGSIDGLVRELEREPHQRLVTCAQNHDQVGNRAIGDRLPRGQHRLALAAVLFAPNPPLIFMGEEYDEERPFQFFTDHTDEFIANATREGRKQEFEKFSAFSGEEVPDPQALETFDASKLQPREPDDFYKRLLALRRELPRDLAVEADGNVVTLRRGEATLILDFDNVTVELLT